VPLGDLAVRNHVEILGSEFAGICPTSRAAAVPQARVKATKGANFIGRSLNRFGWRGAGFAISSGVPPIMAPVLRRAHSDPCFQIGRSVSLDGTKRAAHRPGPNFSVRTVEEPS